MTGGKVDCFEPKGSEAAANMFADGFCGDVSPTQCQV